MAEENTQNGVWYDETSKHWRVKNKNLDLDLTEIFGEGKEPHSYAEFERFFPMLEGFLNAKYI
jgi:hypothetical protein